MNPHYPEGVYLLNSRDVDWHGGRRQLHVPRWSKALLFRKAKLWRLNIFA